MPKIKYLVNITETLKNFSGKYPPENFSRPARSWRGGAF